MILKAQRYTGTAAGVLERLRNAFNWSSTLTPSNLTPSHLTPHSSLLAGVLKRARNAFNWSAPETEFFIDNLLV